MKFLERYGDRVRLSRSGAGRQNRDDPIALIHTTGGILHFEAFSDEGEKIREHEVGHVIAATDQELFLPNLGLPTTNIPHAERDWDMIRRTETLALVAQCVLDPERADRMVRLGSLFRINVDDLRKELALWNLERLHHEFEKQLQKIESGAAAPGSPLFLCLEGNISGLPVSCFEIGKAWGRPEGRPRSYSASSTQRARSKSRASNRRSSCFVSSL